MRKYIIISGFITFILLLILSIFIMNKPPLELFNTDINTKTYGDIIESGGKDIEPIKNNTIDNEFKINDIDDLKKRWVKLDSSSINGNIPGIKD